jgi:hypothetical protein
MALVVVIGSGLVGRDSSMLGQVIGASNLFMMFLLSLSAVFPVSSDSLGSFSEVETEPYGEVITQWKKPRAMAKALASDANNDRGGVSISVLMVLAVALQTLLDSTRFLRHPRNHWRSFLALLAVWTIPWTLPKIWRVAVRIMLVLLVGSITRVPLTRRVLANTLGAALVLTGRQRQSVMAPLRWVSRNIPKGWTPRPEDHDDDDD